VAELVQQHGIHSDLVSPGESFELAFRLYDKVASDQELQGDYFHVNESDSRKDDPSVYHRFETRSYWGDVALYDGTISDRQAAAATKWDWLKGAKPINAGMKADRGFAAHGPLHLRLETDATAQLPATGYPVRTGVPFAEGMLQPHSPIELRDPAGERVPVQTTVLSKWKDGSVKWLLLDFIAYPDCAEKKYTVVWEHAVPTPPSEKVKVHKRRGAITVDTGAVRFTVPRGRGEALLTDIERAPTGRVISSISGVLECRTQDEDETRPPGPTVRYIATRDSATVEAAGPIRATVRIDGHLLDSEGRALGKIVMRVHAYAGLPYVHIFYRVFNNSDQHRRLDLSRLVLHHEGPQPPWSALPEVVVTAPQANAEGADGILVAGDFGLGIRHFWQQFPKAVLAAGDVLNIDLYHPTTADSVHNWFAWGEAKRHELMISLAGTEEENRRALGTFQNPPRLFDKYWHTQSGGWGPATWRGAGQFREHHKQMRDYSRRVPTTTTRGEYGYRNFGDWRYGSREHDGWFNNYYDPTHSQFVEYLMGGEREWFQRAEAMCRHVMDIDTVHANSAKPDWEGGIHIYIARHHNVGAYNGTYCLSPKGMLDYYHLTGDPVALETAIARARYVARENYGIGARSVREQAWPLTALLAVYRETWDPQILAAATKLFEDTLKAFDPRRGCYAEYHGSWTYHGDVPWMCGQMLEDYAMYWWVTGDRRAAAGLVALASSLYCEDMGGPQALPRGWPPTRGPYGVTTYSTNPFLAGWSPGYVFLTNTGWAYAYDLTGRQQFLEAARAGYQIAADQAAIGFGTYWQAPILLFYLKHFEDK